MRDKNRSLRMALLRGIVVPALIAIFVMFGVILMAAVLISEEIVARQSLLVDALARQGNFRQAIDHFSTVLQMKPDHTGARRNLELVLKLQGKSAGVSNTKVRP